MLRLLADENFNGDILRGLALREPKLDVVRIQDVCLESSCWIIVSPRDSLSKSFCSSFSVRNSKSGSVVWPICLCRNEGLSPERLWATPARRASQKPGLAVT